MVLTHKLDHEPEAYLRLAPGYFGLPRVAALLIGGIEQIQALEDAIWSVITGSDIDAAERWALEALANVVGETARPDSDEALRTLIKGRIRVSRSNATLAALYDLLTTLGVTLAHIDEASLSLLFLASDIGTIDPERTVELLEAATAATVDVRFSLAGSFALPDINDPDPPPEGIVGVGTWSNRYGI